jgi:hypothetical protein
MDFKCYTRAEQEKIREHAIKTGVNPEIIDRDIKTYRTFVLMFQKLGEFDGPGD